MPVDQQRRLQQAHAAQDRGDHWAASDAWRRYVLIEDALRDPQDLLDEGLALLRAGNLRAGKALALRTPHCLVDLLSTQLLPAPFGDV